MTKRRPLRTVRTEQVGLGQRTIMDRALATTYGARYVHLAVFAIDVDRVYWLDPQNQALPFGWEVFLTEYGLLRQLDPADPTWPELLAATCAHVLEESPGEPPLGGQIVFAVYDAFERKRLGPEFAQLFASWKQAPRDLVENLAQLWAAPDAHVQPLAGHCLNAPLQPPLAAPTRASLEKLAGG